VTDLDIARAILRLCEEVPLHAPDWPRIADLADWIAQLLHGGVPLPAGLRAECIDLIERHDG